MIYIHTYTQLQELCEANLIVVILSMKEYSEQANPRVLYVVIGWNSSYLYGLLVEERVPAYYIKSYTPKQTIYIFSH